MTQRDGRVTQLEQVYIRGGMIRFYIVPDMLQNAPMFKRIGAGAMKGRGIGTARGRATIARATCGSLLHLARNKRKSWTNGLTKWLGWTTARRGGDRGGRGGRGGGRR